MTKPGEIKPVSRASLVALDLVKRRAPWTTSTVSALSDEGIEHHKGLIRLAEAMIIQAIGDLHYTGRRLDGHVLTDDARARLRNDARGWLNPDTDAVMSFAECCELVGLDPHAASEAILALDEAAARDLVHRYRKTAQ